MLSILLTGLPGQPVNLDFSVKDSNLIIRWEPPSYDGGSEILKYHVSVREGDNEWQTVAVVGAPTTYCKMVNVVSGIKYYFRICGENKNGKGNSAESKAPVVVQEKGG